MAPRIEDSEPNRGQIEHEQATANRHMDEKKAPINLPIVWRNVAVFIMLHFGALYGLYTCFYAKWQTNLFGKCNCSQTILHLNDCSTHTPTLNVLFLSLSL